MKLKFSMHVPPVLTLFLLCPLQAEIIVGSTPANRFMDIIPAIGLYGSGALLIREITIRSNAGWLAITGMGIAFGIMEEAFALQSVFNPHFLGNDISFGRWAGVNWVWTVFIIFYHALFSIAIPVRITEFIYYPKSNIPWTTGFSLLPVFLLYLIMLLYYHRLFVAFTGFTTTTWRLLLAVCLAIIIAITAARLPLKTRTAFSKPEKIWHVAFTSILTLLWFLLFSIIFIENGGINPVFIMISGMVVMAGLITLLHRLQTGASPGVCISALMTCTAMQGLYGMLVLSVSEDEISRLVQAIISVLALAGLYWLKRKLKNQTILKP